jgi:hypothetical protein
MAQTFRFARQTVFASCAAMADDGFEDRPDLRKRLPKVWGHWLQTGAMRFAVVEDDELNACPVIAFAATVFLNNNFANHIFRVPKPHLAIDVVEKALTGDAPILNLDGIRVANAANMLNLYLIHYTERFPPGYPGQARRRARNKMTHGLLDTHTGFGLRQVIHEFCGEEVLPYSLGSGMQLRSDYLAYYETRNLPLPPASLRPFLVGLTREEAVVNFGKTMALLFDSEEPIFDFSLQEQDVLWITLFEKDDVEWIAKRLNIGADYVKLLMSSVYEKVARKKLDLLANRNSSDSRDDPKRGREKKRIVLQYLRQHVEELHPFSGENRKMTATSAGRAAT